MGMCVEGERRFRDRNLKGTESSMVNEERFTRKMLGFCFLY